MKSDSVSSASSESSEEDENKDKEENDPTTWEIMKLCEPEKILMIVGVLAAVAVGASFPMFAVLFGETYAVSKVKICYKQNITGLQIGYSRTVILEELKNS